jgi:hypothetical protein
MVEAGNLKTFVSTLEYFFIIGQGLDTNLGDILEGVFFTSEISC